jgi:RNA polymerase sigma-70 factor, ECF subfamily
LLPAQQRAVLILRDVLGFSGAEVAEALETSEAAVYSALQRAHKTIDQRLLEQSQQETLRTIADEELNGIMARYVDAWERADVVALAAMLAEDAVWSMPPRPEWFRGPDAIALFLRAHPLANPTRLRISPTRANGQLAFTHDEGSDKEQRYVRHGLHVLALDGNRIGEITVFLEP